MFGLTGDRVNVSGVLGRDEAGVWRRWFEYQDATYLLLELPGDLRVCAEGGKLELRAAPNPSAAVVVAINDQTLLHTEAFVLTQAETPGPGNSPPKAGSGWYFVRTPQQGWAFSRFVTDAGLGNCQLRDAVEKGR